jgi:DNA-binding transcriptional MerR regulator
MGLVDGFDRQRISKSANAFRTISEVADQLDIPQHVLRFWETRFAQIQPLKRAGGRRYYRPEDVELLRRIRSLLYQQGYTIKGVQKLLREPDSRVGGADSAMPAARAEAPRPEPIRPEDMATIRSHHPAEDPARIAIAGVIEELEGIRADLLRLKSARR